MGYSWLDISLRFAGLHVSIYVSIVLFHSGQQSDGMVTPSPSMGKSQGDAATKTVVGDNHMGFLDSLHEIVKVKNIIANRSIFT